MQRLLPLLIIAPKSSHSSLFISIKSISTAQSPIPTTPSTRTSPTMDEQAEQIQSTLETKQPSKPRGPERPGSHGSQNKAVQLSKALSKVLRHQASSAGITLDREGFAPLDRVLAWGPIKSLKPTLADIQAAVKDSDKQRFALRLVEGRDEISTDAKDWVIRANQGHSIRIESEALLRPILPAQETTPAVEGENAKGPVPIPPTVVHGTYYAFWPQIVSSGGLRVMGRTHVHCSIGLPEEGKEIVSGMRRDAEVLVYIDVERSVKEAGMKWWMSENGVVLTEGIEEDGVSGIVPARFFREVVGRKRDVVGVLWRDGEKVADLPGGLKVVVPVGKKGTGTRRGEAKGTGK